EPRLDGNWENFSAGPCRGRVALRGIVFQGLAQKARSPLATFLPALPGRLQPRQIDRYIETNSTQGNALPGKLQPRQLGWPCLSQFEWACRCRERIKVPQPDNAAIVLRRSLHRRSQTHESLSKDRREEGLRALPPHAERETVVVK
ncbi:MAG: hypothetical protein HY315_02700, partial [Acidobacteria bacterium]|nr:hypothetical protein [Acidobacteriota bacterium]